MPYKSEKQRKYMHAKHPEIAEKWDKKYGTGTGQGKKKRAKTKSQTRTRTRTRKGK